MCSSDIESSDIELHEEDDEEEDDNDDDEEDNEDDEDDDNDKSQSLLCSCSVPLYEYKKVSSSSDEFMLMVRTTLSSTRRIASHIM